MAAIIKPGWSRPATILFACETPAHEKAFDLALAEAAESGAELILFHAYDTVDLAASASASTGRDNYAQARNQKRPFEALAQRAKNLGVQCKIVVRQGDAAEQILGFLGEHKVDRVVMGSHTPGPAGKLLVGTVAEAVLRNATVPVGIVGPKVVEAVHRNPGLRAILCAVDSKASSGMVAKFAADLAARIGARLILLQVIPHQQRAEALAGRNLGQVEEHLRSLIPAELQNKIDMRARAMLGDPTEELLRQARALRASLIVLGAQGASHFAAISRAGIVYKVTAYAHCPVITLSPVVLADCPDKEDKLRFSEHCLAGVF